MKLWKVGAILGTGALCVVTGGLAAPAVGTAVGGLMGLSGCAATSAGLAAIGGGSLAAGGLGMAGGTAIISAAAGGAGILTSAIATNAAEGTKAKKENEKLRNKLRQADLGTATKQKIIEELHHNIEILKAEIAAERIRADKSDEKLTYMEGQLNEILETLKTAEEA